MDTPETSRDKNPGTESSTDYSPPADNPSDSAVLADGGHPPGHSPEPSTSPSSGAEYYVVDEARPAVVDGPLSMARARTLANEYGPNHVVASRDAVRQLESASNTTVRWEIDDVDVVTDGGRRVGWRRRDIDAAQGDAGVGDQTAGGYPHAGVALPGWDCLTNRAGGDSR